MTDFLLPRTDKIKSFRKANPNRVNLANLLLELEWELCSLVTSSEKIEPAIPVFLQQIHEYHCEGIIFIMRGRPVPAMAMMRLACELGRDTFRISEKPKRLQLFYDTSREKRRERTEVFRFDESNPGEKVLFQAWDHFSTFGVHRHVDLPTNDAAVFEHHGQSFVRFGTDPRQVDDLFVMTFMCIVFYISTTVEKMKTFADQEPEKLRCAYRDFALSYFDRVDPVDRFIKARTTARSE
jgi:hypothetical protein